MATSYTQADGSSPRAGVWSSRGAWSSRAAAIGATAPPPPPGGYHSPPDQLTPRGALNILVFLCGVWLIYAPEVLDHRGSGAGVAGQRNDLIIGLIVAVIGLFRVFVPAPMRVLGWIVAALGGWLVIAPFALGYPLAEPCPATVNSILVGLTIAAAASASAAGVGLTRTPRG